MEECDDAEEYTALYQDGCWTWDDKAGQLAFIRNIHPEEEQLVVTIAKKVPTGVIEFRDDIDIMEQLRYRRLYRRKCLPEQPDIVTLQVGDCMAQRLLDLETRFRTPASDEIEDEYTLNLNDLRLLVAKEYCVMILGGADTRKYHHMGPTKRRRSLTDKDANLFEMLLRMSVQIVWLGLGRKSFNQIELEINRLFKTDIFNAVEHVLKTDYIAKMPKEQKKVLLGPCLGKHGKLNAQSPLMNEVKCDRPINYMMFGIGVIKMDMPNLRLSHMHTLIAASDEKLVEAKLTIGIIGLPRDQFDMILKPLPKPSTKKSRAAISGASINTSTQSTKSSMAPLSKLYPNINLPPYSTVLEPLPATFSKKTEAPRPCSETQRLKWLDRLKRLRNPSRVKVGH